MTHDLFPSGPWTGFYNYSPKDKHRMDLNVTFAAGKLSGAGNNDVGPFVINGGYDSRALECSWVKTYPGSHDVYYRGFREGKGIGGAWDIGSSSHGGFHIWPKRSSEGDSETAAADKEQPALAVVPAVASVPAK